MRRVWGFLGYLFLGGSIAFLLWSYALARTSATWIGKGL